MTCYSTLRSFPMFSPFSFQYLFWSLQLEEWMYLAIPFIHAISDKWKFHIATFLIITTLVYSAFIVFLPYNEFHLLYFMPPFWLGAYGWGIIAYLLRKKDHRANNIYYIIYRANNIYYIILGLLFVLYIYTALNIRDETTYEFFTRFLIYNLVLCAFALLILNPPKVLSRITVFLGEASYGIYLWTLLFQELFGVTGIVYGILAAIATEFPLRRGEIRKRMMEV